MKRMWFAVMFLSIFCFAGTVLAIEALDLEISRSIESQNAVPLIDTEGMYEESYNIGNFNIKFYSYGDVDTSLLLEDVVESDDLSEINSKIDSKRKLICPDAEITVEISPNSDQKASNDSSRASGDSRFYLYGRVISKWNTYLSSGKSYYYYKKSYGGCLFTNVDYGKVRNYKMKKSGSYYSWSALHYTTGQGYISDNGGYQYRGFLVKAYRFTKVDIIIFIGY